MVDTVELTLQYLARNLDRRSSRPRDKNEATCTLGKVSSYQKRTSLISFTDKLRKSLYISEYCHKSLRLYSL